MKDLERVLHSLQIEMTVKDFPRWLTEQVMAVAEITNYDLDIIVQLQAILRQAQTSREVVKMLQPIIKALPTEEM